MEYLVTVYFNRATEAKDTEKYSNKKKAMCRARQLKNSCTFVAVTTANADDTINIIGGYVADTWEGSELIKGYKFTEKTVPDYLLRKIDPKVFA